MTMQKRLAFTLVMCAVLIAAGCGVGYKEGSRQPDPQSFIVFTGNANRPLAEEICANLEMAAGRAMVRQFADGETYLQIQENVRGADVPTADRANIDTSRSRQQQRERNRPEDVANRYNKEDHQCRRGSSDPPPPKATRRRGV